MVPTSPVYRIVCAGCGQSLELPVDLTAVHIDCPSCGLDNVLAPELIQARQRQFDMQQLAAERARQTEQQQLMRQRMVVAKRAASRRSAVTVLVVIAVILALPLAAVAGLFTLGVVFGKRAIHSLAEAQDPRLNGMPLLTSEIQNKLSLGCERVLEGPTIRVGSGSPLRLTLDAGGPCVHLLAATSAPAASVSIVQTSQQPLNTKFPEPAPTWDYRFCPTVSGDYEFRLESSRSEPFTLAAIACPRTVAEGLVRSDPNDPTTSGLDELRGWIADFRARGCRSHAAEPSVSQGKQVVDVDSTRGGPCFNLLVLSHFADATLTAKLSSPNRTVMAEPAPATRLHLEYCPSETGRHQVEITPSTRDHYATVTLDCPRAAPRKSTR